MAKSGQPPGGPNPVPTLAQASQVFGDLGESMQKLSEVSELTNLRMNRVQNALFSLHTLLQGMSTVTQLANIALNGFSTAVQGIAGQIGGLVRLVNPGVLDRFQRAFSAFQAQLGTAFLPVLVGLTGLVQTVANAIAGLNPHGKLFIVFLSGAVAGLTAGVTAGGIFVAMLGTVAGGLITGSLALEAFSVGLDAATAGVAAIGAVIGVIVTGLTTAGSASAGGLAALGLASGGLESFQKALKPLLATLIGAFNSAGATLLPALASALDSVLPALNELFSELILYVPLLAEVLVSFGTNVLPELVRLTVELVRVGLPFVTIFTRLSTLFLTGAGAVLRLTTAMIQFGAAVNPIFRLVQRLAAAVGGTGRGLSGESGRADPPVTRASYGGIEDLFKRAQENALLGAPGQNRNTEDLLKDKAIQKSWADTIGLAVGTAMTQFMSGNFTQALMTAQAAVNNRTP